jgi:aerobic-type carbon monoxide dehydrogenase small subunit (CoxS/CutS family)
MSTLSLTINGQALPVEPAPGETLLSHLRSGLGLRATRQGCGTGHCGACTVILDGQAVQSCQLRLSGLSGVVVETLEAVRETDMGGRIVAALIRHQAAQCGYCLPGIVMSAHAALARSAEGAAPDPAAYLSRNICRCGAHPRILAALRDLAGEPGA